MRHIGTTLVIAFVTLTAGTASAQGTPPSSKAETTPSGRMATSTPKGKSSSKPAAPDTSKSSAKALTKILAGLKLSKAQKDSVARIDYIRAAAPSIYTDATYLAAVRRILTPEQLTRLDQQLPPDQSAKKATDHPKQ